MPYFLYFEVDPKDIDVNIHPTKTEIKFENEQAKLVFKVNTGAAVLGLGYIIGLKYAFFTCLGSLVVWWLIVPGMSVIFHDSVLSAWDPSIVTSVECLLFKSTTSAWCFCCISPSCWVDF